MPCCTRCRQAGTHGRSLAVGSGLARPSQQTQQALSGPGCGFTHALLLLWGRALPSPVRPPLRFCEAAASSRPRGCLATVKLLHTCHWLRCWYWQFARCRPRARQLPSKAPAGGASLGSSLRMFGIVQSSSASRAANQHALVCSTAASLRCCAASGAAPLQPCCPIGHGCDSNMDPPTVPHPCRARWTSSCRKCSSTPCRR